MSKIITNQISPRSGDTVSINANVSVAGTISYQDVSNVDAVGVITARNGINIVGGGLTVTGVSTFTDTVNLATGSTNVLSLDTDNSQNSVISHLGSGSLTVKGNNNNGILIWADDASGDVILRRGTGGGVVNRLATTSSGVTVTGTLTATSFSGDGSNLTGIEAGSTNFVASGNIANGATVVINSDGTVSTIAGSGSVNPTAGTPVVFENSATGGELQSISATFDSNANKVVVAYRDDGDSDKGKAVVGTVSGTSISFGTPVVFNNAQTSYIKAIFDSNSNKIVIVYTDVGNSYRGTAIVGTVSGT